MGLLHKAGFVKTEMRETLQAPVTLQHLIMNLVAGGLEGCAVELSGLCSPTLLGCISPSVWQSVSLPRRRQRISAGRLEIPGDTPPTPPPSPKGTDGVPGAGQVLLCFLYEFLTSRCSPNQFAESMKLSMKASKNIKTLLCDVPIFGCTAA